MRHPLVSLCSCAALTLLPSGALVGCRGTGQPASPRIADVTQSIAPLGCRHAGAPGEAFDIKTRAATPLGLTGFSANGCIHPHGQATTYYFEYGKTLAYGAKTPEQSLPARIAAFYHESWEGTLGGWAGGLDGKGIALVPAGGTAGGYVRYTGATDDDANHIDGIGHVNLVQYLHAGTAIDTSNPYFGGGDPDMRDARIAIDLRGSDFVQNGAELVFWAQSDSVLAEQNDANWRRANWAYTGFNLTDFLLAGGWRHVEYRLENNTEGWSYAGNQVAQKRPNYTYWPLNDSLGHQNCNFFHMLVFVDPGAAPTGGIDLDEIDIAYRNHSLLLQTNGGRLVSAPPNSIGAERLTDGWRNGADRSWRSAPNPTEPLEIVYELARTVTIDVVQIHQNADAPTKDFEVLVSADGTTWTQLAAGTVPEKDAAGPNYAFFIQRGLKTPARHVKVRLLSGHRPGAWGLGEIELFGTGAVELTDDDWYNVNLDIKNLEPGATYHYRVVAKDGRTTRAGSDQSFTVPVNAKPHVVTGRPSRVRTGGAKLEGRLTSFGKKTDYFFEYGPTPAYGTSTPPVYGGIESTPRTVFVLLDDLVPGTKLHYRLVAVNDAGRTEGADEAFTTK